MIQKTLVVQNKLGLHARAAATLVKTAQVYESKLTLSHNNYDVNGKSIMSVMMLAAAKGTELKITLEGPDEEKAMQGIEDIFNNKFNEE